MNRKILIVDDIEIVAADTSAVTELVTADLVDPVSAGKVMHYDLIVLVDLFHKLQEISVGLIRLIGHGIDDIIVDLV